MCGGSASVNVDVVRTAERAGNEGGSLGLFVHGEDDFSLVGLRRLFLARLPSMGPMGFDAWCLAPKRVGPAKVGLGFRTFQMVEEELACVGQVFANEDDLFLSISESDACVVLAVYRFKRRVCDFYNYT